MQNIIVSPRFRDKIPKPTPEEYRQLEENILHDGEIREPLVLWRDHDILLDGHNRWKIYQEHTDALPFPAIRQLAFDDEDAAEDWMLLNQLGRRNLNEMQITALRGMLYKARKASHGGKREMERGVGGQFTARVQNGPLPSEPKRVADDLAEQLGIGATTIKRAEHFVDGLDAAEAVVPGFKDEILTGHTPAKKSDIAELRKMEPEQIVGAVEEIRNPQKVTFPTGKNNWKSKPTEEEVAIAKMDERVTNKTAKVEYGIEDLLEDLTAIHEDFFNKYLLVLDIHRDVALDKASDKKKVLACLREFETRWKNEVKEIFA